MARTTAARWGAVRNCLRPLHRLAGRRKRRSCSADQQRRDPRVDRSHRIHAARSAANSGLAAGADPGQFSGFPARWARVRRLYHRGPVHCALLATSILLEKLVHLAGGGGRRDSLGDSRRGAPTRRLRAARGCLRILLLQLELQDYAADIHIWMRLLRATPPSVLWLGHADSVVQNNLRREAAQRGIGAERLVFAPREPMADYLARHRHADLFLDTLPYNAVGTAYHALLAGLPVLTCAGET